MAATGTNVPANAEGAPLQPDDEKKSGKKPSVVWLHFTRYTDEHGAARAYCNYCKKDYCANTSKNGTSAMVKHLRKCKNKPKEVGPKQQHLSLYPIIEGEDDDSLGELVSWKFDQDLYRRKLIEMIIKDEFPFKIVDGEGFKEFVRVLQPKFRLISRWTISRDCYQLYLDEKLKLRNFFVESGQSVCITTDTWTSLQRLNYMCITAHFIDKDWKLNKKIINFCTIERHKGDDLGRQIDTCLRDWGIARVFSVTIDNASSNDTCLSFLKTKLSGRGCCLLKGKFLHMRCVAHIIALVVNDGLKEIGTSVKRIREAVRYVRQSPMRLLKFRECCLEENILCKCSLCLDTPTRWNSTFLMLSAACKFEKAFEAYSVKDPYFGIDLGDGDGVPLGLDWDNCRRMCELLVAFFDLTVRVSGTKYVTSNEFLHEITSVSTMLNDWMLSDDDDVKSMGTRMRTKFDKYWGDPHKMNHIIFLSVVVDPRYKFEFLEYVLVQEWGEEVGKKMGKWVLDSLHELYDAYKEIYQPSTNTTSQSQSTKQKESSQSSNKRVLLERFKRQKVQVGSVSTIDELDVYCNEIVVSSDDESFDILMWWKLNQHRFPVLCHLARDVLAVPISTVASESAFSTGGRVLDPFRSSLTPTIVESLICTQDWLRRAKDKINIEETIEDIQKHEEGLKNLSINDKSEESVTQTQGRSAQTQQSQVEMMDTNTSLG